MTQAHVRASALGGDADLRKQTSTCMLRSCDSCLRSALVLCCRPCRWSCICRRDTVTGWLAPEDGGGIRAKGADGVKAAQQVGCKYSRLHTKLTQRLNDVVPNADS